jgi:hypothetical protein
MSQVRTGTDDSAKETDSRLLQCVGCGNFCSARTTNDGELVPYLGTPDSRCPGCDGDKFEQVVFATDTNND